MSSPKNYIDQVAIRQATKRKKRIAKYQRNAKCDKNESILFLTTLNRSKTSRLYISKADIVRRFVISPDLIFNAKASDGNNP